MPLRLPIPTFRPLAYVTCTILAVSAAATAQNRSGDRFRAGGIVNPGLTIDRSGATGGGSQNLLGPVRYAPDGAYWENTAGSLIVRVDRSGQSFFGRVGTFSADLCVTAESHAIVVRETPQNELLEFDLTATQVAQAGLIGVPTQVEVDTLGRPWVAIENTPSPLIQVVARGGVAGGVVSGPQGSTAIADFLALPASGGQARMWVAAADTNAIQEFDGGLNLVRVIRLGADPSVGIDALELAPDGSVWVDQSTRGLLRVDPVTGQDEVVVSRAVEMFGFDAEGSIWSVFDDQIAKLDVAGGTILDMRGGESHKGSHSPYSKLWRHTGGGALLRLGAHPVGLMLWLKREEGLRRDGRPIVPVAVLADCTDLGKIASLDAEPREYVARGWVDVESWGTALIEFSDGSRGNAWGADTTLGGMESRMEIQASNARYRCNLSPSDLLQAYTPDAEVFGDAYVMEKVDSGAGWTTPMPDEDWTSGHLAMCADFVEAAAANRPARADGRLGADVVRVIYAAYVSATEGRRVEIPPAD